MFVQDSRPLRRRHVLDGESRETAIFWRMLTTLVCGSFALQSTNTSCRDRALCAWCGIAQVRPGLPRSATLRRIHHVQSRRMRAIDRLRDDRVRLQPAKVESTGTLQFGHRMSSWSLPRCRPIGANGYAARSLESA
jgi:hypothetical protein